MVRELSEPLPRVERPLSPLCQGNAVSVARDRQDGEREGVTSFALLPILPLDLHHVGVDIVLLPLPAYRSGPRAHGTRIGRQWSVGRAGSRLAQLRARRRRSGNRGKWRGGRRRGRAGADQRAL